MSQNVRVASDLEFQGLAEYNLNVLGNMVTKKYHLGDDFVGVSLDTNLWATSLPGTSDTIAISEIQGGCALLTTGTVDDDSCMMSTAIIWSGTKKAVLYARIHMVDVSGTALFVGFSDAKSESNNSIAIHYAAGTLTTVATDAAGFVIDADKGTSSIYCASVKNNTDTTPIDTGVDWTDGQTRELWVILDGTTARFFMSTAASVIARPVAAIPSSVTAATLLCGTIQAMTRAADGANEVRVYRTHIWQDT